MLDELKSSIQNYLLIVDLTLISWIIQIVLYLSPILP